MHSFNSTHSRTIQKVVIPFGMSLWVRALLVLGAFGLATGVEREWTSSFSGSLLIFMEWSLWLRGSSVCLIQVRRYFFERKMSALCKKNASTTVVASSHKSKGCVGGDPSCARRVEQRV